MRYSLRKALNTLTLLLVVLSINLLGPVQQVAALSGSQFNPANIVDAGVFFNPGSLSAGDIQGFLNAKVPVCDTNGVQASGHAGYTRAQWGAANGYSAPYTCLKDYTQTIPAKSADSYCGGGISAGNKSAAQIIYDVSQACGISPKALIVLLQKEQSLVTDDWPWSIQYRSATGYGCPDTAPCDAEYYGFFNQVYNAAHQFQRYVKEPQNFNFAAGRTSNIQYNPNAACGSSPVGIQNGSTAALYNYTPYQPNAPALANLYGTGDSCSAYGNRNFWRMFNDWFGSTQTNTPYAWGFAGQWAFSDASRTSPFSSVPTVQPNGTLYVRIKALNLGNQTWSQSNVRVGTSFPGDRVSALADGTWLSNKRPAALLETSVPPGQTGTFEFAMRAPATNGTFIEHFNLVVEGVTWMNNPGLYFTVNVVSPTTPTNSTNTSLPSGTTLNKGQYMLSPDSQTVLAMQMDGNLVLYSNTRAIWNTGTVGAGNRLVMQTDGNLVLYSNTNAPLWNSGTPGVSGATVRLQTDGNLVIYNPGNSPIWATNLVHNPDLLTYVNTALYSPAIVYPGQRLETADRKYHLILQTDGNLVLYSPTRAIWASGTVGKPAAYLAMQTDGNLVLYDATNRPLWHTFTSGRGASRLAMQTDGNLVLYDATNRPAWNTGTPGAL